MWGGEETLKEQDRDGIGSDGERVGTLFVVKEEEEYCFLYERDNPGKLYEALFDCADAGDSGLSHREVMEMIEGIVPTGLRRI
jgi:hypothetical protein